MARVFAALAIIGNHACATCTSEDSSPSIQIILLPFLATVVPSGIHICMFSQPACNISFVEWVDLYDLE